MVTEPDEEPQQPQTYADVMNAFDLDSTRQSRSDLRTTAQRRDATRGPAVERPIAAPVDVPDVDSGTAPDDPVDSTVSGTPAAAARPYAWTGGRTVSRVDLAIETLVSLSEQGRVHADSLRVEHQEVAELCEHTRSVAEIAALLSLPLGVARVLLGDMAQLGAITVHHNRSRVADTPDLALMGRVLEGLRRL